MSVLFGLILAIAPAKHDGVMSPVGRDVQQWSDFSLALDTCM